MCVHLAFVKKNAAVSKAKGKKWVYDGVALEMAVAGSESYLYRDSMSPPVSNATQALGPVVVTDP